MAGDTTEIRLSGFGGQGIILAGYILGRAAAVHSGRNAVMAQSYGPESRGGACQTEILIADSEITYPRVTDPDVIVSMSQEAYRTYGAGRDARTLLIVDEDLVTLDPAVESGRRLLAAPLTRAAEELGRRIAANIVMLGFLSGATRVVTIEALREAVRASVPRGSEELNLRAVDVGHDLARARAAV